MQWRREQRCLPSVGLRYPLGSIQDLDLDLGRRAAHGSLPLLLTAKYTKKFRRLVLSTPLHDMVQIGFDSKKYIRGRDILQGV